MTTTAYFTTTLIAIAANGFSGIAALLRFRPIMPGMARAGVPESWLVFPIGTLKTLGTLGLAAGLALHPLGLAAAIGLVLFFVCAIYTHIRVSDYGPQFGLAIAFLTINVAVLVLGVEVL
jgi:DoxX-like family